MRVEVPGTKPKPADMNPHASPARELAWECILRRAHRAKQSQFDFVTRDFDPGRCFCVTSLSMLQALDAGVHQESCSFGHDATAAAVHSNRR